MDFLQMTWVEWCLLGLVFLAILLLIFNYTRFLKVTRPTKGDTNKTSLPISVVIASRDEQEQLRLNLPFFLKQDYPEFEVVVVIDDSDKDMIYIMREFEKEYTNLKIVKFEWSRNFFRDRKFAESIGLKAASHEHILLSSVDTRPLSPNWISRMQALFTAKQKIVIGYNSYEVKKGFANTWIRYDNFIYALQYMSSALSGNAFTADRRNLAFDRNLFYEAKGIAEFYNVETGDEDVFVNKAADKDNVTVQIHPDSFTRVQSPLAFKDWFNRAKRHQIILRDFKPSVRWKLVFSHWLNLVFYLGTALAVILYFRPFSYVWTFSDYGIIAIGALFLIKNTTQLLIFKKLMTTFKEKKFLFFIPLFELMMLVVYPSVKLASLFTKRIKWK